ncbi:hypothetical protein Acr_12g0006390 [Actinidia rufa]|uniref:Transmembrane protein n=1 Tax=Actinidia rufa TaxID=165716 RepID=A0A7J0FHC1_9ERIC|nr:hypothetical protein Acr_12g0006390 [Actinidia rufa]
MELKRSIPPDMFPNHSRKDVTSWVADPRVSSQLEQLGNNGGSNLIMGGRGVVVWFSSHVPRFSFISWLAIKGRRRTRDRLVAFGLSSLLFVQSLCFDLSHVVLVVLGWALSSLVSFFDVYILFGVLLMLLVWFPPGWMFGWYILSGCNGCDDRWFPKAARNLLLLFGGCGIVVWPGSGLVSPEIYSCAPGCCPVLFGGLFCVFVLGVMVGGYYSRL